MARMKMHVPAALVDPLYHELQMVWEMHTERIATGETGQLAPRPDAAQKLQAAKSQRHAVGELLDQVDWDGRRQDEPIDLVGSDTLLAELARPLLSIFGERINEACQAAVDHGHSIEPLVELGEQLDQLLDLLRQTGRADQPDAGAEDEAAELVSPLRGPEAGRCSR